MRYEVVLSRRAPSRLLKKQMTTALLFSPRRAGGPRTDRSDAAQAPSAAEHRPRRARVALSEIVAGSSYGLGREVSNAHQVVGREGKRKHPVTRRRPRCPGLRISPTGLDPPKISSTRLRRRRPTAEPAWPVVRAANAPGA